MIRDAFRSSDWDDVHLVVFDVDGTLYRKRSLQLRMARDLLRYAASTRDFSTITLLANYRRIREQLGDAQVINFEHVLIARTAAASGNSPDVVRATVKEWMEQKPLSYLPGCRYPGVAELFAGLRRNGKVIGILSDYPVEAKLAALGLIADHIVTADDGHVGVMKPHPRGLELLCVAAGVETRATLVVGDRVDRDGTVARQLGARILIRSSRPIKGWQTFARFNDKIFAPVLTT
jgi:putative hydrolase of the HAD superfamily